MKPTKPSLEWRRKEIEKNLSFYEFHFTEAEKEKTMELLEDVDWENFSNRVDVWECLVSDVMLEVNPDLEEFMR